MSLDESKCKLMITKPDGMTISVAQAINGGDFQVSYCCKNCKTNGSCDVDGEGY